VFVLYTPTNLNVQPQSFIAQTTQRNFSSTTYLLSLARYLAYQTAYLLPKTHRIT
jgi:hypothetical protein